MIRFHFETDFGLEDIDKYTDWVKKVLHSEDVADYAIDYIYCTDEYLYELNHQYLSHATYTDILTFDYSELGKMRADIFISVERVRDNAAKLGRPFTEELLRVMAHGLLHLVGYQDKKAEEIELMRRKEEEKIRMFHVEQNEGNV